MAFVDGENLTMRYQSLMTSKTPHTSVMHRPDIYIWHNLVRMPEECFLVRAYYYTSYVGDEAGMDAVTDELKGFRSFRQVQGAGAILYPTVFKKPSKSRKTTTIDLSLAIDVLRHVHQDDIDIVFLFSGDDDYCGLVDEVRRRGKQVYVSAFSSGLSKRLARMADVFQDLDPEFFTG